MEETKITNIVNDEYSIAVLIDGDNAQAELIESILAEASKYGRISFRRIYGDWTEPQMNRWKLYLQKHAILPIQQFRNTKGKNATDSSLIIDAMDILHKENVEAFCIVSSDSDFTRLATRLREARKFVLGIGERKTPEPFIKACSQFVYTENLDVNKEPTFQNSVFLKKKEKTSQKDSNVFSKQESIEAPDPLPLILKAYDLAVGDDGKVLLSSLGIVLLKLDPSFDPRTYNKKRLLDLVEKYSDIFEIDKNPSGAPIFIKIKD